MDKNEISPKVFFKFRAWEKYFKEMIPVHDINFDTKIINTNSAWRMLNEVVLMMYTGFNDKHGKEIYDGDILMREGFWSIRIEYTEGGFFVRDLDSVRYNNLILDMPIHNFILTEWEVVGNIFENPELLDRS